MKTKSFYKAILAAVGVYTLWGFSFLASSVGQRVATPFVLLSYRLDIAGIIVVTLAENSGGSVSIKGVLFLVVSSHQRKTAVNKDCCFRISSLGLYRARPYIA